ncbi:MAG: DUF3868 domain-containing protein [Tannerellaceae bacterium]
MKGFNLLFIAFVLFFSANAFAQDNYYSGSYSIQHTSLKMEGDSVYVQLEIAPANFAVKSNRSISFVPCLTNGVHQLQLPHITVKGRNEYNAYKRQLALASEQERVVLTENVYSVMKSDKKTGNTSMMYQFVVGYESWMEKASLDVFEDMCGCGDAANRIKTWSNLASIILPKPEEPVVPEEPEVEEEVKSAVDILVESVDSMKYIFVDFKVNRSNLEADYLNNAIEMAKITELITRVQQESELKINSILITGFASPEGSVALNRKLSIARAQAFVNYLKVELNLPESLFKVDAKDENWDGVLAFVQSSDLDSKTEILAILRDEALSVDQRKQAIMQVDNGRFYAYMLKEWYPHLRKVTCYINYERKQIIE